MPRLSTGLGLVLLAACLAGCEAPGLIYTHITVPLDLDLDATRVDSRHGQSDWKTYDYVIELDWNSAAIADAARAGGITEIDYADMEITSVFFGAWVQRRAIVYGR